MKRISVFFTLITCTFFAISTVYSQDLPTPFAAYNFEDDASDEMENYDGILEAGAVIDIDDERGYVLSLLDSGYVSISPELANELEDFSFTAWVNFAGTVQWAGLMGMGKLAPKTFPYWDFHIRGDIKTMSFYSSAEAVWPSDGCSKVVDNFVFPDPSEWVHIAFSFTKDTEAMVYVNGEIQTTSDWREIQEFDVSPSMLEAEIVTIGRDAFNQGTLTNTKIDNFRFYNSALSEDEVLSLFMAGDDDIEIVGKNTTLINDEFKILPNFSQSETIIKFYIPENRHVKLSVINTLGQEVAIIVDELKNAGNYSMSFNSSSLKSGIYLIRFASNGRSTTKRMLVFN